MRPARLGARKPTQPRTTPTLRRDSTSDFASVTKAPLSGTRRQPILSACCPHGCSGKSNSGKLNRGTARAQLVETFLSGSFRCVRCLQGGREPPHQPSQGREPKESACPQFRKDRADREAQLATRPRINRHLDTCHKKCGTGRANHKGAHENTCGNCATARATAAHCGRHSAPLRGACASAPPAESRRCCACPPPPCGGRRKPRRFGNASTSAMTNVTCGNVGLNAPTSDMHTPPPTTDNAETALAAVRGAEADVLGALSLRRSWAETAAGADEACPP